MSDEQDVERGRLAQEVLKNPVYDDAYKKVEQGIIESWREARSQQDREQLHQMLMMLTKTRAAIESTMQSGQLAQANITQKQNLLQRVGSRLRSV